MDYSETALRKVREDRLLLDAVDEWLYEEIAPFVGRRVLEIGCGLGNFAKHLIDRDIYIGTETSQESVDYVNQLYGAHPTMQARVADATADVFADFAQFKIDTVFSLNVFEHIHDHLAALRNAHAILQPGGRIILVVPAHMWLYGSIDRAIGHYRRYDKKMLAELFRQVGFNPLTQKYINAPGAIGWWANGRLRQQETPPSAQLRLFNRLVPLIKWIERKTSPPFGISVLAIGEK